MRAETVIEGCGGRTFLQRLQDAAAVRADHLAVRPAGDPEQIKRAGVLAARAVDVADRYDVGYEAHGASG